MQSWILHRSGWDGSPQLLLMWTSCPQSMPRPEVGPRLRAIARPRTRGSPKQDKPAWNPRHPLPVRCVRGKCHSFNRGRKIEEAKKHNDTWLSGRQCCSRASKWHWWSESVPDDNGQLTATPDRKRPKLPTPTSNFWWNNLHSLPKQPDAQSWYRKSPQFTGATTTQQEPRHLLILSKGNLTLWYFWKGMSEATPKGLPQANIAWKSWAPWMQQRKQLW